MSEVTEAKMTFHVERVQWAEIDVDVAGLIEEWGDADNTTPWEREDVLDVLHRIGATDLLYSGDFIEVVDSDYEESIA